MNKIIKKLILRDIKIPLSSGNNDYDAQAISISKKKIRSLRLKYSPDETSFAVFKRSVDARKKNEIYFVYSVVFSLKDEVVVSEEKFAEFSALCRKHSVSVLDEEKLAFGSFSVGETERPVVAGFGPCGMFIALVLAKSGFRPIVVERGSDVDTRAKKVESYWNCGVVDCESNVQFGEGGAGTFSDGKLMTRINDKLCSYVLETFHEHGADRDILYNAKPHVGTDKLREIVKNIRKTIESYGGKVLFGTRLDGIRCHSDGRLRSVITSSGELLTDSLFLAVGHSARDTFEMLMNSDVEVCAKPFSVGVRIEHLQSDINKALYGDMAENPALPVGEYSLSRRFGEDAVYSFCMCPGGTVVASASEQRSIVTNGMSYSSRDGVNANSAIAVSVRESDFGGTVQGAIEYQRSIEKRAYELGCGAAPIQNLGSFLGRCPASVSKVLPTYTGKTKLCDLNLLFPEKISRYLKDGILSFEKNIEGFSADHAMLTAPETRTSSPVRIVRQENFESASCKGLYPCGEGAGYAGGITSAAVDGIRCALSYIEKKKETV